MEKSKGQAGVSEDGSRSVRSGGEAQEREAFTVNARDRAWPGYRTGEIVLLKDGENVKVLKIGEVYTRQ